MDLDFYDNLISHIRGLDDLVHLTSLDLSFNKIKHIKHVSHLKNLTDLFFVANKISKIEGLEGLDKLRSLELGSNRIRALENLDSLKALEELWVAKNKITEISGLGGLPNLRLLSIQSNRIRDLTPLKNAPQLEELYISHNALESLEGLENNTKLKTVDVSNNQIKSLKGLGPLVDLEEFWASYNQIDDFVEVEKVLGDKKALTTVYFEGNPLQLRGPAVYRNKVRLALPQLQQIDASKSTSCSMRLEYPTNVHLHSLHSDLITKGGIPEDLERTVMGRTRLARRLAYRNRMVLPRRIPVELRGLGLCRSGRLIIRPGTSTGAIESIQNRGTRTILDWLRGAECILRMIPKHIM